MHNTGLADIFKALSDGTRRLILDELATRDGYTLFEVLHDIPGGDGASWLTVVSPDDPDGAQLRLEPADHPAVKPYRDALVEDGIPLAQFLVDDVQAKYERLTRRDVVFTQPPTDLGEVVLAVFDDTCRNLVQIVDRG